MSTEASTSHLTTPSNADHINEAINAVLASSSCISSSQPTDFHHLSSPVSAYHHASSSSTTEMAYVSTRCSSQQPFTDLPENLMDNSSTPPLESLARDERRAVPPAPATSVSVAALDVGGASSGHHQQQHGAATAVFASLTPVDVPGFHGSLGGGTVSAMQSSLNGISTTFEIKSVGSVPSIRHLFSSTSGGGGGGTVSIAGSGCTANGPTLVSTSCGGIITAVPGYLAVKIDPHGHQHSGENSMFSNNINNSSATLNVVGASSSLLSPAQLGLQSCNSLNLSNISSSPGDFLSLTPSTVYVQPINQNGQLQFVKLNLSSSPSSVTATEPVLVSSGTSRSLKRPSTVNTVDLANTLIATMLQEQEQQQNLDSGGQHSNSNNNTTQMKSHNRNDELPQVYVVKQGNDKWNLLSTSLDQDQEWTYVLDNPRVQVQDTDGSRNGFIQGVASSSSENNDISIINSSSSAAARRGSTASGQNVIVNVACGASGGGAASSSSTAAKKRSHASSASMAHLQGATVAELNAALKAAAENDEADEDIFIDTKDLCNRIAYELKAHSIPQAVFAERVLCRSQGTLSDLLRNPKPWNKLKSGRETFRRMYYWLKMPLQQRMSLLDTLNELDTGAAIAGAIGIKPVPSKPPNISTSFGATVAASLAPLPIIPVVIDDMLFNDSELDEFDDAVAAAAAAIGDDLSGGDDQENSGGGGRNTRPSGTPSRKSIKRPRLVFTDIQKRTLQAIFKETQRPSREMQQTIAEHLGLDLSTVQNFFMNARRRSRLDLTTIDDGGSAPYPYQQVRTVTPPPTTPSPPYIDGGRLDDDELLIPSTNRTPHESKRRQRKATQNLDGSMTTSRKQRGAPFSISVVNAPPTDSNNTAALCYTTDMGDEIVAMESASPPPPSNAMPLGLSVRATMPHPGHVHQPLAAAQPSTSSDAVVSRDYGASSGVTLSATTTTSVAGGVKIVQMKIIPANELSAASVSRTSDPSVSTSVSNSNGNNNSVGVTRVS